MMEEESMFKGAIVAIVTPFRNGKVDEEAYRNLIEFQIANGTDGIVPCGTTGESSTLSHEEHDRVIDICVDAVKKRVPVIAGTGSNSTEEAIRMTRHAYEVGADGALMVCPYYNRPTQEGLYQHYKAVAEAVPIPIIVYNIPSRTGVNLLPDTLARLAKIPNIVGVKEASGLIKQMSDIIGLCGKDFTVLSNVAPADMAGMVDAFFAGDLKKAQELHHKMSPLIDAMFIETNPTPAKAALAMMGKIAYEVRLPLWKLSDANHEKLRKVMQNYGLIK
jgi:4-hydroxy-tetrahydrodipicolinate synthase